MVALMAVRIRCDAIADILSIKVFLLKKYKSVW
jgi:hypothetical protein